MREITTHKINECNEALKIQVLDEPGQGGACHRYVIKFEVKDGSREAWGIGFQNGPIKEVGVNGITHEALLAILIDRLRGFQSGAYACYENEAALMYLEHALAWLHRRTREREARGVEGTHAM